MTQHVIPPGRGGIHRITIHIMDRDDLYIAHCGRHMFQGGGGIDEYCGPKVTCEDVVRIRNAHEGDARLWVYYAPCRPCMDEQLNRLGHDWWEKKPLRDLAEVDL